MTLTEQWTPETPMIPRYRCTKLSLITLNKQFMFPVLFAGSSAGLSSLVSMDADEGVELTHISR